MTRVAAEQRIFSLILALITTGDRGSSKETLLSTVHGYADRYRWGGNNTTLERMFERDKDQLRDLGIPIETFTPYDASGNNQESLYRIHKSVLQIPRSLNFSPAEVRMLNAAALVWEEGSLSEEAQRALMKLSSLSGQLEQPRFSVAPALSIAEPSARAIRSAMTAGREIRFSYRKAGKRRQTRQVAPLRLHRADGRWHLIAFDQMRNDYRTFLLSRISGEVTLTDTLIAEGLTDGAARVEQELEDLIAAQPATLHVAAGSRADYALSARGRDCTDTAARLDDGWRALELNTLDYAALADELIAYGSEVVVIDPPKLSAELARLAARIADLHTEVK